MNETADRVACIWLAVIASEEQWFELVSVESIGQARGTPWVRDLQIEPAVLLAAAADICARRTAFEQVRALLLEECPSPPCWDDCLRRVVIEVVRMYYRLRLPPPGTAA